MVAARPGCSSVGPSVFSHLVAREQAIVGAVVRSTPRELQVLPYIARGYTNHQVAGIVHLSPKTVDVHRTHIMTKLGIHDRVTLARFAIREGLIPVWDE